MSEQPTTEPEGWSDELDVVEDETYRREPDLEVPISNEEDAE